MVDGKKQKAEQNTECEIPLYKAHSCPVTTHTFIYKYLNARKMFWEDPQCTDNNSDFQEWVKLGRVVKENSELSFHFHKDNAFMYYCVIKN